jgi:hypothetical protein
VPLVAPDFFPWTAEAVLVFIPIKDGKGQFLKVWGDHHVTDVKRREKSRKAELGADSVQTNVEDPKKWQGWLNQLLKKSIGHELNSTTLLMGGDQQLELRGMLKTKDGSTRDVKVLAGTDTFAVSVRLYPRKIGPLCLPAPKIFLKDDVPVNLPFWPPDRPAPPPPDPPRALEKKPSKETASERGREK